MCSLYCAVVRGLTFVMAWLFKPCCFTSIGMKLHKIIVVAEVSDCCWCWFVGQWYVAFVAYLLELNQLALVILVCLRASCYAKVLAGTVKRFWLPVGAVN